MSLSYSPGVGYWVTTFALDGTGWLRPVSYWQAAYGWVYP